MQDRPREQQAPQEATEQDSAADFVEQWLKIREARGQSRQAAAAELTAAGAALLGAINADKDTSGTT